jgi:phosphopantothenoylcysteine decarboxylase/phosphopantothenate--cysteine ligase
LKKLSKRVWESGVFNKTVITSGPTIEPIDPVRYLSNRSSGKTGYYIALEALKRNLNEVVFITGPTSLLPSGCRCIEIETAMEMRSSVMEYAADADIIIMAAAVCDYRAKRIRSQKIKKSAGEMQLELVKNPDILREIGSQKRKNQLLVGFAAETRHIFSNATKKLREKNLDLLVLNQISETNPAFDVDTNQVYFMTASDIDELPVLRKNEIAVKLWDKIVEVWTAKTGREI